MKLQLYNEEGDGLGHIEYNDSQNYPNVGFEVVLKGRPGDRKSVVDYLTTRRSFDIPYTSDVTDQYDTFVALPTAQIDYFELALCELGERLGIFLTK